MSDDGNANHAPSAQGNRDQDFEVQDKRALIPMSSMHPSPTSRTTSTKSKTNSMPPVSAPGKPMVQRHENSRKQEASAHVNSSRAASPDNEHQQRSAQLPLQGSEDARGRTLKTNAGRMVRSASMLDPIPRPASVPFLPLAGGQPSDSQLNLHSDDLRPMKTAMELYGRDARGASPMS